MGTWCRRCGSWSVTGHNHRRWLGETPFVQVSTTWALTCPETVRQRPCMTRKIETWLSDSRVSNSSVVDHRSWWPVLSPLCNCFNNILTILCIKMQAVEVDAQTSACTGQFGWASMIWSVAALWCREGGATLLSTGSYESYMGCKQPEIRCNELWSWVSMRFV